ncbi:MAG: hypothetical protein IIC39_07795 [Candidatus Marinimicrobia bacterium]|nr:hypothetical protein [Candidatus Neomarinimicrobiota bacterium]MCH8303931.1 hypothetical protein [Candidatus Neomarinimicrobiota bacterium]
MIDLYKSLPYALSAYIVIGVVLTSYFGTIIFRISKATKEIRHIESLSEDKEIAENE